jgi:hypothetical protein
MKITKARLKQLVKEELQAEGLAAIYGGEEEHHQILNLIFREMPHWEGRPERLARHLKAAAALINPEA